MSINAQISVRSRKLGVLIRDARTARGKNRKECAQAVGVTSGVFLAYEEGRKAPSLPELEVLAYFLNLPLSHFWSKEAISDNPISSHTINLPALVGIRQRLIGALLRQERMRASLSVKALSELSGVSTRRLKAYELGELPVPLPELEGLVNLLQAQIESFFDQSGTVGLWIKQQSTIRDFLELPAELQDFACKPVNRPYLELALKLSGLSTDKLRSVAEGLLDITL